MTKKTCYIGLDKGDICENCIFYRECPLNTYVHDIYLSREEYYIKILEENQEEETSHWDY